MLKSIIPSFDAEMNAISEISTMGSILAFNVSFKGPEHFWTTFPKAWHNEYEGASLHFADPAVIWPLMNVGDIRWSEINLPDVRSVFKKARVHGLNYGALFSRKDRNSKTILSVSREDRELTDGEMMSLSVRWSRLATLVDGRAGLTDKEMEVLALARDGFDYSQIANKLGISRGSVNVRATNARSKLGANSITHAVAIAIMRNYFSG